MELEKKQVRLQVRKDDRDPPPPLQRQLDLSKLVVDLQQALEIARQVKNQNAECQMVYFTKMNGILAM